MRYLCIVHLDYAMFSTMSAADIATLEQNNRDYDAELAERRHLIAAHGLSRPENGLVIKVRDGEMSMTDGPFTEAKEQMAGFLLVEARDMTEATTIAAGIPLARYGQIELRPIYSPSAQA